jgi:transposase-like protein
MRLQLRQPPSLKRLRRTREETRRIVEATFVPGASIARVARENGVNPLLLGFAFFQTPRRQRLVCV